MIDHSLFMRILQRRKHCMRDWSRRENYFLTFFQSHYKTQTKYEQVKLILLYLNLIIRCRQNMNGKITLVTCDKTETAERVVVRYQSIALGAK